MSAIILNPLYFYLPGVPTTDAFQPPGTVMVMMTVEMVLMSHLSIVSQKAGHALVTYSPAITATASLVFTFAMATTTVWITPMKMLGTSAVSTYFILLVPT